MQLRVIELMHVQSASRTELLSTHKYCWNQ